MKKQQKMTMSAIHSKCENIRERLTGTIAEGVKTPFIPAAYPSQIPMSFIKEYQQSNEYENCIALLDLIKDNDAPASFGVPTAKMPIYIETLFLIADIEPKYSLQTIAVAIAYVMDNLK